MITMLDNWKNKVIQGDCRELADGLPDDCFDLVFTDPPYPDDFIWVWSWLPWVAARVLKPGGYLLSYAGKLHLSHIHQEFAKHLDYFWEYCIYQPDNNTRFWSKKVFGAWRPIVAYKKPGDTKLPGWGPDAMRGNRDKNYHAWGQGSDAAINLLERFTYPEGLVFEPFAGGGQIPASCKMSKRHFVAFELEAKNCKVVEARLRATNPPLIYMQPDLWEQGAFDE